MSIRTYQDKNWEVIPIERREALETIEKIVNKCIETASTIQLVARLRYTAKTDSNDRHTHKEHCAWQAAELIEKLISV